jgi:hypothetical protein
VYLVRRARLKPAYDHARIQLLEVLGLDPVDPMSAQARDEVPVHRGAVCDIRLVAH